MRRIQLQQGEEFSNAHLQRKSAFNAKAMISDAELTAIFKKGVPPQSYTIFRTKAVGGQWVEFKTNGNGFYEMLITNP